MIPVLRFGVYDESSPENAEYLIHGIHLPVLAVGDDSVDDIDVDLAIEGDLQGIVDCVSLSPFHDLVDEGFVFRMHLIGDSSFHLIHIRALPPPVRFPCPSPFPFA